MFRIITNGHHYQVQQRAPGIFTKWEEAWVASGPLGLRAWPQFETLDEAEDLKLKLEDDERMKSIPWVVVE